MELLKVAFLIFGGLMSIFYGGWAKRIWFWPCNDGGPRSQSGEFDQNRTWTPREFRPSWHWHQIWINGVGSAIGWVALYYIIFNRIAGKADMGFFDVFVVAVGIAGIMGFLPSIASRLKA